MVGLARVVKKVNYLAARPLPVVASARLLILATVAIRFYHLRARRAGTWGGGSSHGEENKLHSVRLLNNKGRSVPGWQRSKHLCSQPLSDF
jgi:hypothetical protein